MASVFTASSVRQLARDPERFVKRRLADDGGGFGNPMRDWIHDAIASYYESGRDPDALFARLAQAMEGGIGFTDWKREREPSMRRMLERFAQIEPPARGIVREVLYKHRPGSVKWRGHQLGIPLSLLVEHLGRPMVRVMWTESVLRFKSRGSTMVAAATLANAEILLDLRLSGIEVWQLRHGQQRYFAAELLHAMYPRLDELLTFAERRLGHPPAA